MKIYESENQIVYRGIDHDLIKKHIKSKTKKILFVYDTMENFLREYFSYNSDWLVFYPIDDGVQDEWLRETHSKLEDDLSFTSKPGGIISTDNLTEYQLEIRTRLREKFNDLQIEIFRGDRLMVNGVVITGGVIIYDSRNRKDYDNDIKIFSDEIKRQYLDRRKN